MANERFDDIAQRMTLLARRFGFATQDDWLTILNYGDVSSVSRIMNGHSGLSRQHIKNICARAGITEREFRAPLWELAETLGLADDSSVEAIVKSIADATGEREDKLHGEDEKILEELPGQYILVYPGREDLHFEKRHIIVEKFKITKNGSRSSCDIFQDSNFITGEKAKGRITSKSSRLSFSLEYPKSYYVQSSFLMIPLYFSKSVKVFSGIYLDTAPYDQNQIFSTRFCMFNVSDISLFPRRYAQDSELFEVWNEVVANFSQDEISRFSTSVRDRNRLIARSGEEFVDSVRNAVRITLEKEEGQSPPPL